MKECEINCVVKDNSGIITQLGFKEQGIHSIFIITRLILSERISIYVYKKGVRVKVVVGEARIDNNSFTTSDKDNMDINELNFLPECNSPN